MKKIGEVALDTGVLILGDIAYLKKIKQGLSSLKKQYEHRETKQIYTQGVDFQKYTDILIDNLSVNDLLAQEILLPIKTTNDTELSTENIINDLEGGFKQIKFENGTDGKAFAMLSEEGFFPIYAETDEKGIARLMIDFREGEE